MNDDDEEEEEQDQYEYTVQKILDTFNLDDVSRYKVPDVLASNLSVYENSSQTPECMNDFRPIFKDINFQKNKSVCKPKVPGRSKLDQEGNADEIDKGWYYKDPTGCVLGPFSGEIMNLWTRQNMIDPSTYVRKTNENHFVKIEKLFPDTSFCFVDHECKYLSPKLLRGDSKKTDKSDVYAFCFENERDQDISLDAWLHCDTMLSVKSLDKSN